MTVKVMLSESDTTNEDVAKLLFISLNIPSGELHIIIYIIANAAKSQSEHDDGAKIGSRLYRMRLSVTGLEKAYNTLL